MAAHFVTDVKKFEHITVIQINIGLRKLSGIVRDNFYLSEQIYLNYDKLMSKMKIPYEIL